MSIKELLKDKLSEKELESVSTAFDIIGNKEKAVAIIEIPNSLKKKKKLIAESVMAKHKNVRTVLEKKSPRKGVFRIRSYRIISGDKDTTVLHKESGCLFKLDPRKTYFSPREGTERLRISELVKEGEKVMVFFAGIGAFAIIIAKKVKDVHVTGIEINPSAVRYFRENEKINKVNVKIIKGDVIDVANKKDLKWKFDRVIMPLPESAINFLKEARYCLKKGGVCNLYCFSKTEEIPKVIKEIKKKLKNKINIIGIQKVLPWGPGIYKYRVDFRII